MDRRGKPNNGEVTHPLKPGTLKVLHELTRGVIPVNEVNPGVRDRFDRADDACLATRVDAPSPYKKDKGAPIPHFQITQAGRDALKAAGWEHGEPRSR